MPPPGPGLTAGIISCGMLLPAVEEHRGAAQSVYADPQKS